MGKKNKNKKRREILHQSISETMQKNDLKVWKYEREGCNRRRMKIARRALKEYGK